MPSEDAPLVLVVDDNRRNLLLARQVLEMNGYRSETARSGAEAREALGRVRPDLILMDIQLPDTDGITLTREIKANPETAAIPIVAWSSRSLEEDQGAALAAGCEAYLSKPLDLKSFGNTLRSILGTPDRH